MAYLILDLDLTTFKAVAQQSPNFNEKAHTLTRAIPVNNNGQQFDIQLINVDELSKLIQSTYDTGNKVMFLTSGTWDMDTPEKIAEYLDISDEVQEQLVQCYFHSANTDFTYFNFSSPVEIAVITKQKRLEKILESRSQLQNSHFVMLDDNIEHLNSFSEMPQVTPVLATTLKSDEKAFYQEALNAVLVAQEREKLACTAENNSGNYGRNTLFRKNSKRKLTEDVAHRIAPSISSPP